MTCVFVSLVDNEKRHPPIRQATDPSLARLPHPSRFFERWVPSPRSKLRLVPGSGHYLKYCAAAKVAGHRSTELRCSIQVSG
jgi:hypothetical protein